MSHIQFNNNVISFEEVGDQFPRNLSYRGSEGKINRTCTKLLLFLSVIKGPPKSTEKWVTVKSSKWGHP